MAKLFSRAAASFTIPPAWMSDPVSGHPHWLLVLSLFSTLDILIGVQRYHTAILICVSLTANGVHHPFVSSLAGCTSSLVKCLCLSLAHLPSLYINSTEKLSAALRIGSMHPCQKKMLRRTSSNMHGKTCRNGPENQGNAVNNYC